MGKFLAMLGTVSLLLTCVGCGMVNNGTSGSGIEETLTEHPPIMQSPIARYFGSVHIDADTHWMEPHYGMFEHKPKSLYTESEQINGEWVKIRDVH